MARTEERPSDTEVSGLDRLREEVVNYLGVQAERLAEKAGDKLTDVTHQLSDVAENGGVLPKAGGRILQGESPLKAFMSEKAKSVKDNVVGKVKEAFGRGGKGGKSGTTKVMNMVEVLDVGVPLRTAYDHWTQYERFSGFAKGVRSVDKGDDVSSNWKVKVGPSTRSWKASVQEQIPDDRIVWTSDGAKGSTHGAVSFHELGPTLTRIVLVVEYYPSGLFEKTGNIWRAQGRRLRLDFKNFQRYVTFAEEDPEGWRGEIREGEVVRSHEEAMEDEADRDGDEEQYPADDEDEAGFDDRDDEGEAEAEEDEYEEEEDGAYADDEYDGREEPYGDEDEEADEDEYRDDEDPETDEYDDERAPEEK
ncbi:SRPBCC family protein [Kitasatospora sp. NBC_00240]|uniref:SRPBCC family protein n=1 Tax=Kitasatospora sp. NBC_00240 TaxID=2903567 RepID=UPI002251C92E|nr:SRPBCC family protein [Kitasatospora sp. NBC_00240]MCX5215251.1 SRPBCC family protein [Kitasatospora sp. NBC_00240]